MRSLIGCGLQFAFGLGGEWFLWPREIIERLFNEVPRTDFFRVYPRRNHGIRKLENRHEADVRLILAHSLYQMPMSLSSYKIRRFQLVRYPSWQLLH